MHPPYLPHLQVYSSAFLLFCFSHILGLSFLSQLVWAWPIALLRRFIENVSSNKRYIRDSLRRSYQPRYHRPSERHRLRRYVPNSSPQLSSQLSGTDSRFHKPRFRWPIQVAPRGLLLGSSSILNGALPSQARRYAINLSPGAQIAHQIEFLIGMNSRVVMCFSSDMERATWRYCC